MLIFDLIGAGVDLLFSKKIPPAINPEREAIKEEKKRLIRSAFPDHSEAAFKDAGMIYLDLMGDMAEAKIKRDVRLFKREADSIEWGYKHPLLKEFKMTPEERIALFTPMPELVSNE